jgi:hypothetical protein
VTCARSTDSTSPLITQEPLVERLVASRVAVWEQTRVCHIGKELSDSNGSQSTGPRRNGHFGIDIQLLEVQEYAPNQSQNQVYKELQQ